MNDLILYEFSPRARRVALAVGAVFQAGYFVAVPAYALFEVYQGVPLYRVTTTTVPLVEGPLVILALWAAGLVMLKIYADLQSVS